jgi:hypothetical protein
MKPQVLEIEAENGRHAWIVDETRLFTSKSRSTGKAQIHYPGAIHFGIVRGGMMRLAVDETAENPRPILLDPRPCLATFTWGSKPRTNTLQWLGASEKSALAMLNLAAAGTAVIPDFANDVWEFGKPKERDVPIVWSMHNWFIAWRINWWTAHRFTVAQRLADLATVGIVMEPGTLRQKLRRLGLVTTRPQ